MTSKKRLHLRWALQRDLDAILAIESTNPDGWDGDQFLAALRRRTVIPFVAEDGRNGEPIGMMVYELGRDHLELLRVAVHPAHRLSGVGWSLMDKFAFKVGSHRRGNGAARVPGWAAGAHLFLRSCGWRGVGVRGDDYLFEFRPVPAASGSTTDRAAIYQEEDWQ